MKLNKYYLHALKYIASFIFVIFIVKFFVKPSDLQLIFSIKIEDLILIVLLGLLLNIISGVEYYYLIMRQNGTYLSAIDVATLPLSMGLWGMLLPFQGALLYLTLFLKYKYKTTVSETVSISIFSYLIAVVITGLVGCYFFGVIRNQIISFMFGISLLLVLSPVSLVICDLILQNINFTKFNFLQSVKSFIHGIVKNLNSLLRDTKTVLIVFTINVLHAALTSVWYFSICRVLQLPVSYIANLFLTMYLKLSIVIKLTPGNIGVDELISGGIFNSLGMQPGWGVLISVIARLCIIILMLSIGMIATVYNMKYVNIYKLFTAKEQKA